MATVVSGMRVVDQGTSSSSVTTSATEYLLVSLLSTSGSSYSLGFTVGASSVTIATSSGSVKNFGAYMIPPSTTLACSSASYHYVKLSTTY